MQEHRFSRLERLIGSEGLQCLAGASIAVIGVGGVGGYATEALVRAGVGRLTLVDFDTIMPSNINRQIHALEYTVGRRKVDVMAERCLAINPEVDVRARHVFYSADTDEELLAEGYDYLLDCIDSITAKLHLIESCRQRGIPVISAMGAANKLDTSLIRVGDLSHTQKCRMARVIRKELGRRGIRKGVRVVYSLEEYRPLSDEPSVPSNLPAPSPESTPARQRVTLGSSSYIPPMFGLTMAGDVIQTLLTKTP